MILVLSNGYGIGSATAILLNLVMPLEEADRGRALPVTANVTSPTTSVVRDLAGPHPVDIPTDATEVKQDP